MSDFVTCSASEACDSSGTCSTCWCGMCVRRNDHSATLFGIGRGGAGSSGDVRIATPGQMLQSRMCRRASVSSSIDEVKPDFIEHRVPVLRIRHDRFELHRDMRSSASTTATGSQRNVLSSARIGLIGELGGNRVWRLCVDIFTGEHECTQSISRAALVSMERMRPCRWCCEDSRAACPGTAHMWT